MHTWPQCQPSIHAVAIMLLHGTYRSETEEQLNDSLQTSEESQEYDSSTIVSDSVEPEGESLVPREQVPHLDVITLDSDEGSDNIEQLDYSGTRPSIEYVELTSTDEQLRMSSIGDESSSSSSEVQLAAVGSGDFGNIVQHKIHLTDHHKLTLLKKRFVPASDYKFLTCVINGVQRHFQYSWLGIFKVTKWRLL